MSRLLVILVAATALAADPPHPVLEWVKRHPLPTSPKPSPRMGYETSYGHDPVARLLIRCGGHNQGGGGEQNSEVWTYDLDRDIWTLKEPNDAPPGVCCAQQNVFHDALGKFVRFPAFSYSHGWQSPREVALKNSSVWTYDLPTNTWRYMRPCPAVWPAPLRGAAYDPRHQVVVLHGGEGARYGTVLYDLSTNTWHRLDPKPRDLRVVTAENSAALTWKPPEEGSGWRYDILRGAGGPLWNIELEPAARGLRETGWTDRALQRGAVYYYQVRAVAPDGKPAGLSYIRRTQPPVVVDLTVSVVAPKRVELEWEPPETGDVAGYLVERAVVSVYSTDQVLRIEQRYHHTGDPAVGQIKRIGQFQRLAPQPIAEPRFVDETVDLVDGPREPKEPALGGTPVRPNRLDPNGRPYRYAAYAYRVRVVNRPGVVSGPSPFYFTYPRAAENVFAREEGEMATRIRWQPVRQKGIVGYLVYRQDGRWNKDPISLLTPKPIEATEFLDKMAGNETRRYEVVAVDSVGQEGEPSRPVWSRREWRRFYIPYTTEWHQ